MNNFTAQPVSATRSKAAPAGNILSISEHNKYAAKFPYLFKHIPNNCPPGLEPYLFDTLPKSFPRQLLSTSVNDYDQIAEARLADYLLLKGYRFQRERGDYSEYEHCITGAVKYLIRSRWVQRKVSKHRAWENYEARKEAGAVATGSLGIVGNNLDACNTSTLNKETRAGLFRAQNMIQKIRLDGKTIVGKAVCGCGKPLGEQVMIDRSVDHNSVSVSGIQTCGSVWACPVCRNKIISKRAEELKELYSAWSERGGQVNMLTLTVPHGKADNLAELYGSNLSGTGLSGALSKFRQSRHFSKAFKDKTGYEGDIRGVEVTWGRANGFHPHIHILLFTEFSFDFQTWKMRFYEAWSRACAEAGLKEPSWEHGVNISHCDNAQGAQYLAKWSAANELVSTSMKKAKTGNFSIAELERCLWDSSYRDQRKLGMTKAASVLRAYYASMKGQRMLQTGGISKGRNWKAELLGSDETDTEIHERVAMLDYRAYCQIKRADQLPALLEAAERGKTMHGRVKQLKKWLSQHHYDPGAVELANKNAPPPSCFGNADNFDDHGFKLWLMEKWLDEDSKNLRNT